MGKTGIVFNRVIRITLVVMLMITGILFLFKLLHFYKYKISSTNGIQESSFIRINDHDCYVQMRGDDVANPLIVFVHGGPGFPVSYLSAYHQSYLESDYTFINYDQRNSGRTFYKNKQTTQELSVDIMLEDLHGVIEYGKNRFSKEKVIIIGQSWGSILGTLYTQQHPENVSAYIGVGQVIEFNKGKIFAANKALEIARESGDEENVVSLTKSIRHFEGAQSIAAVDLAILNSMIVQTMEYLQCDGEMPPLNQMFTGVTSSDMNIDDVKWFLKASNTHVIVAAQKPLIDYMYYDFKAQGLSSEFHVPVYFIQGACDYITPTKMVEDYYQSVEAPDKRLITLENLGHTPFLDDPHQFAEAVKAVLSR